MRREGLEGVALAPSPERKEEMGLCLRAPLLLHLLDPTQAEGHLGGVGWGPVEEATLSHSSPEAIFRGGWGASPRNGYMADPSLPLWVQGREAQSAVEY